MPATKELHNQAMRILNQAEELYRQNPEDTALAELYYKSCLKDVEAAHMIEPKEENEPKPFYISVPHPLLFEPRN